MKKMRPPAGKNPQLELTGAFAPPALSHHRFYRLSGSRFALSTWGEMTPPMRQGPHANSFNPLSQVRAYPDPRRDEPVVLPADIASADIAAAESGAAKLRDFVNADAVCPLSRRRDQGCEAAQDHRRALNGEPIAFEAAQAHS